MRVCFECSNPADHRHHVVPRSLGGTRTVDLCTTCHGLVHDRNFLHHQELTRQGLERARRRGIQLGNPKRATREVAERVVALRAEGLSWRGVCAALEAADVAAVGGGTRWYPATARGIAMRHNSNQVVL